MPIKTCHRCNENYIIGFDCSDYVHECNSGNNALDQEDVVITGNWEDYTGSENVGPQTVMRQGMENELFGTQAGIEGYDKDDISPRGNKTSTHRQRQHLEFIEIKKEDNKNAY